MPVMNDRRVRFFAWSDQHIAADGDYAHVIPAVQAINALPDIDLPPQLGRGKTGIPDFVFGGGDMVDIPTAESLQAFDDIIHNKISFRYLSK